MFLDNRPVPTLLDVKTKCSYFHDGLSCRHLMLYNIIEFRCLCVDNLVLPNYTYFTLIYSVLFRLWFWYNVLCVHNFLFINHLL